MAFYRVVFKDELYHHGIKGQKWGVRNGPPYPLRSGKGKRVDNGDISGYNKRGKAAADRALNKCGGLPTDSEHAETLSDLGRQSTANKNAESTVALKRLSHPETLEESLIKANPMFETTDGYNNCTCTAIAGYLRQKGYDVAANGTNGEQQHLLAICEDCFVSPRTIEGTAVKFGKSPKDASDFLRKRFGDNAEGCCGIKWVGDNGGHTFSWKIENGKVSFFDFQARKSNVESYWRLIDDSKFLHIVRLDNAEFNKNIFKYVHNC